MSIDGSYRIFTVFALSSLVVVAGCASRQSPTPLIDPDVARARITRSLPPKVDNPTGWAVDMFAALEALRIEPNASNICAVVAVTEQESTFTVDPKVPGLPAMAKKEIDSRAESLGVPRLLVRASLQITSPDGRSYSERLDSVRTEKELSRLFEDFIGMVPMGERLFGRLNPVRTGGPMQVSIAYAQQHAEAKRYPYPVTSNIRNEVFTRRGGMYFGIAHLLDYPVSYNEMVYRFADFNAGHYASRNAAFQNAVSLVTKTPLVLDGDLLLHGDAASQPSKTELAVRKLAQKIDLSDAQIRSDLERGDEEGFDRTKTWTRVFALADKAQGSAAPRAVMPRIVLKSPKITRKLTTEWFARRVDERYKRCLARGR